PTPHPASCIPRVRTGWPSRRPPICASSAWRHADENLADGAQHADDAHFQDSAGPVALDTRQRGSPATWAERIDFRKSAETRGRGKDRSVRRGLLHVLGGNHLMAGSRERPLHAVLTVTDSAACPDGGGVVAIVQVETVGVHERTRVFHRAAE